MSDFKPYDYQILVGERLLKGRSIILQAPTGAGKTFAALIPFIHAQRNDVNVFFPKKCIYVVPMRVLAHQFLDKFDEYARSYERKFGRKIKYSIQTGDQPDDRRFESDLIFCTVDQFLSSNLTMPYGLPNRLANINAGSAVGSYLVFDEFHLLDPESTLPSAWHAIKQFSRVAPVLLMTATFSQAMIESLALDLNAEVVTISTDEAKQIENRVPTIFPRQRIWETASQQLSSETILKLHKKRSLVLCNTVNTAQRIYREIKKKIEGENLPIKILLLHSRFLPADRRIIEESLLHYFGNGDKCDTSGSVIAIATQTIEVGVDITSEVLHTELAPASALIQRAGRCARYPGEQGKVIVYPVEKFTPYATDKTGKAWKDEMQAAFQWLQSHSGEVFDFEKEQELVNAVATPRDQRILKGLFAGETDRKEAIFRVLSGDQQSADGRLLIRDADSCRILIHPSPDDLLDNPKTAIGFNLQPSSLYGFLKEWEKRADELDLPWIAKVLYEPRRDDDEGSITEYRWVRLDKSLISGARLIVVNPDLAGYDPNEGFLPYEGGTPFVSSLPDTAASQTWEGYSYNLEKYEEHIQRVLVAFGNEILPEFEHPALALEKAAKWQAGSLLEAAWLACLLHDVGKLSDGWQGWAHAHQAAVGNPIPATCAAAHTDTDRKDSNLQAAAEEAAKRYPKPHHAAEGALAAAPILFNLLSQELAQAAITAITRHHSPFASENQTCSLENFAGNHVSETIDLVPTSLKKKINPTLLRAHENQNSTFAGLLAKPNQVNCWLAYTLLVRALRRSDQLGTSYGNK